MLLMALFSSKWLWAVLVPLLVLLLLFLLGKKAVNAEITIDAPPQAVWAVLTDVPHIQEWNSVLVPIEGQLQTGNTVTYTFYQEAGGKGTTMQAKVQQLIPHELLHQTGGIQGVLTFNHKYLLAYNEGATTVTIHEEYRGIMVPFWNPKPVGLAYHRLLTQLKARVTELKQHHELNKPKQ